MVPDNHTDIDLWMQQLANQLKAAPAEDSELFQTIVNAPFENKLGTVSIFLGVIVLLLVNPKTQTIDRLALSNTDFAERTKQGSVKKFEDIRIPLGHPENAIAQAIATSTPHEVMDWKYLFIPELNEREARYNQADGGIAFSCVQPLTARDAGAMIFSFFQPKELMENSDYRDFMSGYVPLVNEALSEQTRQG